MSEFFSDKDYGDYFSELEARMNTDKKAEVQRSSPQAAEKATTKRTTKPRKKPLARKRAACCTVLLAVVATGIAIAVICSTAGRSLTPDSSAARPDKGGVSSSEAVKSESKTEKDLFASFTEDTAEIGEQFKSESIIVINNTEKKVVAARNAQRRCYPASTTKIMTLLVAAESIKDFTDTFTMTLAITDPLYIADATVAGFSAGEEINMTDLLYGAILPSGADACMGLAEKLAGSEEGFVKLMNAKAAALGLKDTHFTNCTGLYGDEHYTTAEDLSVILAAAMENTLCRAILSTYQYTTAKTPQHPEGILLSSTLFQHMYGTEPVGANILGGKTGFVNESGYCIASFGESDTGSEYICVTLSGAGKWPTFYDQIDLYTAFAK